MSIILFILGAGALLIGSVRVGPIQAEGPAVRAAGFVLTLPLILTNVLSIMLRMIFGSGSADFVSFLELPVMAVAVGVAYYLLTREGEGLPSIKIDDTKQNKQDKSSERTTQQKNTQQQQQRPPQPPRQRPQSGQRDPVHSGTELETANRQAASGSGGSARRRGNYPNVMTIREAASYLNMTEQAVTNLIEEGKLAAARINYRYRISRTVLDDFITSQQQDNTD